MNTHRYTDIEGKRFVWACMSCGEAMQPIDDVHIHPIYDPEINFNENTVDLSVGVEVLRYTVGWLPESDFINLNDLR